MKRTTRILSLAAASALAFTLVGGTRTAAAENLTADQIVARTNHASYYQGSDGRADVTMTIIDSQKRKRVRKMTILRKNASGNKDAEQKFYVYFHKPADVAKTVFIVHKHITRDDDRWLYLPALDLVKRIAASDKRSSFVGSDFVYEDLSGRSLNLDRHELVKTTKSYYVLEHKPKKTSGVKFSRYVMYVHRGTFLPTKVTYYDKSGKKYRIMTVNSVKKIQGRHTVTKATMQDLGAGSKTITTYKNVRYDSGLPSRIFTERYLRRAPVKYLR